MPKVSVVIPVYNVERYLRECLDSALAQTLQDIEIICVDDGSTDGCPGILDGYAAADSRVKVIHKPNGGYGHAMNTGLDAATGEYVGILESDDVILPGMYETLYQKAVQHDLDFVRSDFFRYWGTYDHRERRHYAHVEGYYDKVLGDEERPVFWKLAMPNWTGIYKRDYLNRNGIRHNETPGASYQDNGFWLQNMAMARRAMWINDAFYLYRRDNPGASIKSRQKMLAGMGEYDFAGRILQERGLIAENRICNVYRVREHYSTFNRIDPSLKKEYARIICEDYREHEKETDWERGGRPQWLFDWITEITSDPDGFCERRIAQENRRASLLQEAERIILYGAGQRGAKTLMHLLETGYSDKAAFFAETHAPQERRLFGLDIKGADILTQYRSGSLVLISVAKGGKAYPEIVKRLDKMGIENYTDTEFVIE